MKKIIIIILAAVCCSFIYRDFYSLSFKTMSGKMISTDSFANKKVMVMILPLDPNDTAAIKTFDSVSHVYAATNYFIGVPCYEAPLRLSLDSLEKFYRHYLGSQVIITEMMYTRKTSAHQHPLFRWLTHQSENIHFDIDASGPGSKYCINASGELVGVFGPATKINNQLINLMIQ